MGKKKKIEEEIIEENIISSEYSEEMSKSFMDYSMSVIVSRAIPDVRDGLKPVHRRILYSMDELGVFHNKPYRKCARVVGDTMGKYHPHGDSSIYDALVVMAQDWKKNEPFIDGQGNFGSIEGDSQAAERYTECRLSKFAENLFLKDVDKDTVNFIPNFDENEKEPEILPAKVPNVLINGSDGIAVGMVTSTPTHNLKEVMEGYKAYIENPEITTKELMKFVKGPDFPTGGTVVNKSDLLDIYETGKGKIKIRGNVDFEPGAKRGDKDLLIISEIPYTMLGNGINKFLSDVAELVKDKKLPEVTDIMNQTSKEGIRLVIELKKNSNVDRVKNILYKKTRLEDTFGVNMLYVVNGRPEQLGLKGIYEHFLNFQIETNTRKFNTLLKKEKDKQEIQEGLIKAIDIIDLIIEIVRGSKSPKDAKECLMGINTSNISFKNKKSESVAKKLNFSDRQSQAILDMRLSKLIGLEIMSLQEEYNKTKALIKKYTEILSSKESMLAEIVAEANIIIKEYAKKRKTTITNSEIKNIDLDIVEERNVIFAIDRFNYVKTFDKSIYDRNSSTIKQDNVQDFMCKNTDSILIFTNKGNMHQIKCMDIPLIKAKEKGVPLDNLCNFVSSDENIISIYAKKQIEDKQLLFVTKMGLVKFVSAKEFDVNRKQIVSTKLNNDDEIINIEVNVSDEIVLRSSGGRFIRFNVSEIPLQKRATAGVRGIKLKEGETVENFFNIDVENGSDITINDTQISLTRLKKTARGVSGTKIRI